MSKLATLLGALVMMVGVPALTLFALGQAQASSTVYLGGIVLALGVMFGLMVALQRYTADPFVLEVSVLIGFAAGLGFVAYLALSG